MQKIKTLAKLNYYILDEDDDVLKTIDRMNSKEYIGSKIPLENKELILDNICYLMRKKIEKKESNLEFKKCKERNSKDIYRYINRNMIDVPNTVEYSKKMVETLIHGEFNEFIYIYDQKEFIGLVEISYEEIVPEITSIIVFNEFRNQGYGRKILQLVENYLSKEYDEMTIVVSNRNEVAYHLYESYGFEKENSVMYYYMKV